MKEQVSDEINDVKDDVEEYINARIDLVKLHTAENLSRFFSGMIIKMVLFYLFFFVLLFSSLAVAIWLNEILGGKGVGFMIVAGFYLLIALLFVAFSKTLIQRPIIQSFIQLFFPTYNSYDESK